MLPLYTTKNQTAELNVNNNNNAYKLPTYTTAWKAVAMRITSIAVAVFSMLAITSLAPKLVVGCLSLSLLFYSFKLKSFHDGKTEYEFGKFLRRTEAGNVVDNYDTDLQAKEWILSAAKKGYNPPIEDKKND
jgi:hypothetical protein